MAKTSMVEREKRRAGIVKKYAAKRAKLKELIRSPRSSPEERVAAQAQLQTQPRDASASRQRKSCEVAGRGEVPGLAKARWWGAPPEHDPSDRRSAGPHSQRPGRGQERSAA